MSTQKTGNTLNEGIAHAQGVVRRFGLRRAAYLFFEELSALVGAGIPILESIQSIRESTASKRLRKELLLVEDQIQEGASLSKALGSRKLLSPRILIQLQVGEQSGNLTSALKTIVLQNEKETRFSNAVRSSLLYVVVVFSIALAVGVATPWIILPQLASFFESLDAELPLITRLLIGTGEFFVNYGFLVFPLLGVTLLAVLYFLFSFPQTKFIGHSILFHLPLSRGLIREAEIARLGYLLGTQLESGITVTESLRIMTGTTTYGNYSHLYKFLNDHITEGYSLSEALQAYPKVKALVPSNVRQLIKAGERSGTLSSMLISIGENYEERIERTAKNIPTILEPILLVLVGGLVAIIALGVLLPVYSLSNFL